MYTFGLKEPYLLSPTTASTSFFSALKVFITRSYAGSYFRRCLRFAGDASIAREYGFSLLQLSIDSIYGSR